MRTHTTTMNIKNDLYYAYILFIYTLFFMKLQSNVTLAKVGIGGILHLNFV